MQRLQVKYCKGEEDLNNFLMTLNVDYKCPRLQSINYVAEVQGKGSNEEINMGSTVIAAVQYFIQVDDEETTDDAK